MTSKITDECRAAILAAFSGSNSAVLVGRFLGVSREKVFAIWKSEFGVEGVTTRGNALRGKSKLVGANSEKPEIKAEAQRAFSTDEPLRAIASRLGVHNTKIREWWIEKFGEETTLARFRDLQARKARKNNVESRGKPRRLKTVEKICSCCDEKFQVRLVSLAKRHNPDLCNSCRRPYRRPVRPQNVGILEV